MHRAIAFPRARVGAAVAVLASALAVALAPAQPAQASLCHLEPRVPYMIDPKLHLLDGMNKVFCSQKVTNITAIADLEVESNGAWKSKTTGVNAAADADYAFADAYYDCSGNGTNVSFRTRGRATIQFGGVGSYLLDERSGSRDFNCGALHLIRP